MRPDALIGAADAKISQEPQATLDRLHVRNAWRIMPILVLGYVLNTLGKTNIGFAALEMNQQLHFSPAVYGLGAGLFFVGYTLFELPSNLILTRVGARFWLSRILITWGLVSAAMALINGPISFYTLRFLLGVAEAGWYPGVLFYLTLWFPRSYRARATMLFFMAVPISAVVGAPLSGALLDIPEIFGIHGWQWLFIVTGLLSVVLGLISLRALKDSPAHAKWLSPGEIEAIATAIQGEESRKSAQPQGSRGGTPSFASRLALFCAVNFTVSHGLYVTSFWLPKAIQSGGHYDNFAIGLITAVPFIFASFALVVFARSSDRLHERKWHFAIPQLAAGAAMAAAFGATPGVALAMLTIAMMGALGTQAVMYAMFSEELSVADRRPERLAAGLAGTTMAGNLAGFVGSVGSGQIMNHGGDYGHLILLIAASFAASGMLVVFFFRRAAH